MNDQKVIPLLLPDLPIDTAVFCAAQAEAIRVLGRRVVRDVIEIGQRLSEVHDRLAKRGRGQWLNWLDKEFGWSENAARRYIEIAAAFHELVSAKKTDTNILIDIGALHLLSHEAVPEDIRVEALDKAEAGDRITLAEAKELIAGEVADKIAELRATAQKQRDEAVASATAELREALEVLIKETSREPTVEAAIEIMLRISGKKQLTRTQAQAIAMLTGYAVPWRGTMIPPASSEDVRISERNLEITSNLIRAVQFFGDCQMTPEDAFAASMPFQRNVARLAIPIALDWLEKYYSLLKGGN
jgi:hypothetical protein